MPTLYVPDVLRRAIAYRHGNPGLASREEVRQWYVGYGQSAASDIIDELIQAEPEWKEQAVVKVFIVPNELREALLARIDAALADAPEEARADRDAIYAQLLAYYNEHGEIPEFSIQRRAEVESAEVEP